MNFTNFKKISIYCGLGGFFFFVFIFSIIKPDFSEKNNHNMLYDFYFENVRIMEFNKSTLNWQARSRTARISRDQSVIVLNNFRSRIYKNRMWFVLAGPQASIDYQEPFMRVLSPVAEITTGKDKFFLKAKKLEWDSKVNLIRVNGDITINNAKFILKSNEAKIDLVSKKIMLLNRCQARVKSKYVKK
ncbi:MAG: hypothetical protein WC860_00380 [Candidatus Margulisiibacteriota bacterium]|jgi:hypothetical protein